jgi:hypothetical protein
MSIDRSFNDLFRGIAGLRFSSLVSSEAEGSVLSFSMLAKMSLMCARTRNSCCYRYGFDSRYRSWAARTHPRSHKGQGSISQ